MRRTLLSALLPVCLLCSTAGALACGDGDVLFEDKLQTPDPSWNLDGNNPNRTTGPNGATWTVQPDTSVSPLNQSSFYEDFEVCVTGSMAEPSKSGGWVGVAFWGTDTSNVYIADVFPRDGSFGIFRLQNNKLLKPVSVRKNDAIKTEANAQNEISVVGKGNHAILTINGKKVIEFNGIPPQGGGLVGIDFGAPKDDAGDSKVTFTNFQVRTPAETTSN